MCKPTSNKAGKLIFHYVITVATNIVDFTLGANIVCPNNGIQMKLTTPSKRWPTAVDSIHSGNGHSIPFSSGFKPRLVDVSYTDILFPIETTTKTPVFQKIATGADVTPVKRDHSSLMHFVGQ